jgi:hypothetical protein
VHCAELRELEKQWGLSFKYTSSPL